MEWTEAICWWSAGVWTTIAVYWAGRLYGTLEHRPRNRRPRK